jgi:hypothetical protein
MEANISMKFKLKVIHKTITNNGLCHPYIKKIGEKRLHFVINGYNTRLEQYRILYFDTKEEMTEWQLKYVSG